jgi:hypothetical protein
MTLVTDKGNTLDVGGVPVHAAALCVRHNERGIVGEQPGAPARAPVSVHESKLTARGACAQCRPRRTLPLGVEEMRRVRGHTGHGGRGPCVCVCACISLSVSVSLSVPLCPSLSLSWGTHTS